MIQLTTLGADQIRVGDRVFKRGQNYKLSEQEVAALPGGLTALRQNVYLAVEAFDEVGDRVDLPAMAAVETPSPFRIVPLAVLEPKQ